MLIIYVDEIGITDYGYCPIIELHGMTLVNIRMISVCVQSANLSWIEYSRLNPVDTDVIISIMAGDLHIEYYGIDKLRNSRVLLPGAKIRLTPLTRHRFKAMTDEVTFIECSTHHEDTDSYYESASGSL